MKDGFELVNINNRWPIWMPAHRAAMPCWPHWEQARNAAMYAAIRPGDTIIDVGAEQGDLSALFASWVGRFDGGIVLIEPSERAWPNIRQTFEANGLRAPLVSFVGFAADTDKHRPLPQRHWPVISEGSLHEEPGFYHACERDDVPVVRLDTLTADYDLHPSVITIDVEGSELLVLKGAYELLDNLHPIVFVSIHPEMIALNYHHTTDDIYTFMDDIGYDAFDLGYDHEYHVMFKPRP